MQSLFLCSFLALFHYLLILPFLAFSGPIYTHSIFPYFTANNLHLIDNGGTFLSSANGTFQAALVALQPPRVYFSVVHAATQTVIWSANRDKPVSNSANLTLTVNGLTLTDESKKPVWSTPALSSPVSVLQLLETGNLVLLDVNNVSLWQSFDYPTDTIVMGQRFHVGRSLISAAAAHDLSAGNYSLSLSGEDLVLQWFGQTYWKLSMDTNSFKNSNSKVSYMEINGSGLHLYGGEDSSLVFSLLLNPSNFRIARIGYEGRFLIDSFNSDDKYLVQELVRPVDFCLVPFICGELGFCISKNAGQSQCTCVEGFRMDPSGCLPKDVSFSLSGGCHAGGGGRGLESELALPKYLNLGLGVDYFANEFANPTTHDVNLSVCQDLCSRNCSCLGVFYRTNSGSCYVVENNLGSVYNATTKQDHASGYVKVFEVSSPNPRIKTANEKLSFPTVGFVLISLLGFGIVVTILVLAILWLQRKKTARFSRWIRSSSTRTLGLTSILGLPTRFRYEEIVEVTENFNTQIGSGGFGTVYKGTMPDETVVAIKKIENLGVRGKKEFCTELGIIGSIHHVNLIKLEGFCIHETKRFLVYEFMKRGSLDRILFGDSLVLKWQDRYKIVLGTARALAYLHSGCHRKIIHCDIKPENILLNESLQVKVSDFGLSKLLDHNTSKLLTTLRGTRGYLAPEWLTSSGITDKTDVFSFGMVLLEIVSGKRNCSLLAQNSSMGLSVLSSSSLDGVTYFPSLALEMHKQRRYLELADPRLEGDVSGQEIEKIVRIALCCVHIVPTLRPTMQNVVDMLEGRMPLGEPIIDALNFLQSFSGGQT